MINLVPLPGIWLKNLNISLKNKFLGNINNVVYNRNFYFYEFQPTLDLSTWDCKLEKLKNKKPIYGFILAWLFYVIVFSSKSEATQVIVNKTVPAVEYSVTDIRAIFTMQKRTWSNKRQIKVYTLSDNNPLHKDFVKNILYMFPHQLRRVWDRLTFSGTGTAPIELDSEQEMLDKIANTPDSIGYLNSKPDNENIRYFEYH